MDWYKNNLNLIKNKIIFLIFIIYSNKAKINFNISDYNYYKLLKLYNNKLCFKNRIKIQHNQYKLE